MPDGGEAERSQEVAQRIAALQHLQEDLEHLARRARKLDPADCEPGLVCHVISSDA